MIHRQLRNLDVLRLDLDEMVELEMHAAALAVMYERHRLDTPEWLSDAQRTLQRALRQKRDDLLALRLQEAKQRLQKLRTPEERRGALEEEIAELEAQLAATLPA